MGFRDALDFSLHYGPVHIFVFFNEHDIHRVGIEHTYCRRIVSTAEINPYVIHLARFGWTGDCRHMRTDVSEHLPLTLNELRKDFLLIGQRIHIAGHFLDLFPGKVFIIVG